jgi:hypothetical protein
LTIHEISAKLKNMESIITTKRGEEYANLLLNFKPRGSLLQHLRAAHSFYHINQTIIKNNNINMFEYGFVDETRPNISETLMDVLLLGSEMIQNEQGQLLKDRYNAYINLVIKAAITKLENVEVINVTNILSSSSEVFEILFGHLFNFNDEDISLDVFSGTPEIRYLKDGLFNTVETFQNSQCLENKLFLLKGGLFVTDDNIKYGYGVKSESQLSEIMSTYFEPHSEKYLPGAVQDNLKRIRNLIDKI